MKKNNNLSRRSGRRMVSMMGLCSALTAAISTTAFASSDVSVTTWSGYTGALRLVNDLTTIALVLCPLIGGLAAVYFIIRRSLSDEQEGKMWTQRMRMAIFCGVGGGLASGVITLVTSYLTKG